MSSSRLSTTWSSMMSVAALLVKPRLLRAACISGLLRTLSILDRIGSDNLNKVILLMLPKLTLKLKSKHTHNLWASKTLIYPGSMAYFAPVIATRKLVQTYTDIYLIVEVGIRINVRTCSMHRSKWTVSTCH